MTKQHPQAGTTYAASIAGKQYQRRGESAFSALSKTYSMLRDESGEGASTFAGADIRVHGKSKVIAHISYNGKVWEGTSSDWKPDVTPLLFDPSGGAKPLTAHEFFRARTLNAVFAAQIIISSWENWTDEEEDASDNILQAALSYARALLVNAPHQIPEEVRNNFADALLVMSPDGRDAANLPNLSFDEALIPLRAFVVKYSQPRPLFELFAEDVAAGFVPGTDIRAEGPQTDRPTARGRLLNKGIAPKGERR